MTNLNIHELLKTTKILFYGSERSIFKTSINIFDENNKTKFEVTYLVPDFTKKFKELIFTKSNMVTSMLFHYYYSKFDIVVLKKIVYELDETENEEWVHTTPYMDSVANTIYYNVFQKIFNDVLDKTDMPLDRYLESFYYLLFFKDAKVLTDFDFYIAYVLRLNNLIDVDVLDTENRIQFFNDETRHIAKCIIESASMLYLKWRLTTDELN